MWLVPFPLFVLAGCPLPEAVAPAEADACVHIGEQGYGSLQDAADAALDGDTIEICAGEVQGVTLFDLSPPRRTITIRGAGMDLTTIDGGGGIGVFDGYVGLTLEDLTVTGGYSGWMTEKDGDVSGTSGAALLIEYADVTLNRVRVSENAATGFGVIVVYVSRYADVTLTLRDSAVVRNHSEGTLGGGVELTPIGAGERVATLVSIDTDWGVGPDANTPEDVLVRSDRAEQQSYDVEGVVSFECRTDTAICE